MSPEISSGCNQQRTPRSGYLHAEPETCRNPKKGKTAHLGPTQAVRTPGRRSPQFRLKVTVRNVVKVPERLKTPLEKMILDLSWDTWIMELLDQENEWEHVFNSVVKHLGGGKIMENKIQSTDCFRFPYTGNSCCICNSVHPEESPHSTTDPWLTYNDTQVLHTTGSAACEEQQHSAYILFYKRNCPDTLQFHHIIPNNSCRVGWRMKTAERAKETEIKQTKCGREGNSFYVSTEHPGCFCCCHTN
ncbi:uncharacterized protein LOC120440483 [Oreochromis aureus]|uniref:uncharacterized protein LOC120440483 n=1 Tax=Oreochromis aureus TaxID=47969 RepID=UPI001954EAEE|nr:uncharacterized protein LOC120440483 [Oreochromis aureus]XP_039469054.1 uncharacterized protein LOC120440483 [Oreochromis aureus]XP_039469055.1 uncharacterized protein LOC120440483 [Oreochromis aureus]